MSFVPTMRLNLTEEQAQWLATQAPTPQAYLDERIAEIRGIDFSKETLAFREDVRFLEDGSTGRFAGAITAWFIKNDEFHIKTTSGDVITMSYAYCRPMA
jgi:hypothetical protein